MFKHLVISALAVFAPIHGLMLAVGFLIVFDTITGVIAAYRSGQEIRSSGFSRVIVKLFVYQGLIMSGFLMETLILPELGLPIVKLLAGVIGLTEFKSLIENIEKITGVDLLKIKKILGSQNDK
jgi:predicted membrane-bound spermidine synthase